MCMYHHAACKRLAVVPNDGDITSPSHLLTLITCSPSHCCTRLLSNTWDPAADVCTCTVRVRPCHGQGKTRFVANLPAPYWLLLQLVVLPPHEACGSVVPDISLPAEWFGWLAAFPDIYSWIPWFAQAVSPKDSKMNLLKVSLLEV